jgi:hypothetical protein
MDERRMSIAAKKLRGLALLKARGDFDTIRRICSSGGINAHRKGTAHQWDSKAAAAAARAGHQRGTAHEFTSDEARAAGRKGGFARAAKRAAARKAKEATHESSLSQDVGHQPADAQSSTAGIDPATA